MDWEPPSCTALPAPGAGDPKEPRRDPLCFLGRTHIPKELPCELQIPLQIPTAPGRDEHHSVPVPAPVADSLHQSFGTALAGRAFSWNHRIDWAGKDLQDDQVQHLSPHCQGGVKPVTQVPKCHIYTSFKSLHNQCLHHLGKSVQHISDGIHGIVLTTKWL